MSDTATSALTLVVDNCKTGLTALSDSNDVNEDGATADFTTLRTDFLSILSLLYSASTKIALALKPQSPQHKAALVPLKDLANNVAALVHSIRLMRRTEGATILAEYERVAQNVIRSIQHFAQGFLTPKPEDNTDYLVGVGMVHELIDNAKKTNAMPSNNRAAVRKKWLQDYDSLADAAEELQDMGEPSDSNDDEVFDDGWEELGFESKQTFSQDERDRIEKVQSLVKLVNLLHKRVVKDILSPDARELDNLALDRLTTHSAKLLSASDELVSSMYTPQQPSVISSHLRVYMDTLQSLECVLISQQPVGLDEKLNALSISKPQSGKITKWLTTCFEQSRKAGTKVLDTLGLEDPNPAP